MAETLTESSTFTSTIQMPTAGEEIGAADLRDKAVQRLADRTTYLKDHVDDVETVQSQSARYQIGTGSSPSLTADFATGYTLASNEIEVSAAGTYLVAWTATLATTGTNNGVEIELTLSKGGSAIVAAAGERHTTTAADKIVVNQTALVQITTPSTEKLSLSIGTSAGTPTVEAASTSGGTGISNNFLSIHRLV